MLDGTANDLLDSSGQTLAQINQRLESLLRSSKLPKNLHDAIHYAIFPQGKRIRPLFAISLARDLGVEDKLILDAACSLELLHCASLIHDDLPALDNDEMRRGKPSCHIKFSEATAILAGDAMVALATQLAATTKGERAGEYSLILSNAFIDLCAGQQLDMLPEDERGDILEIHRLKTGALFAAACSMAGVGAGLREGDRQILHDFGEKLGVLFQVTDDYLDIYGDEADRGRPGGSDVRNQKETVFFSANASDPKAMIDGIETELSALKDKVGEIAKRLGSSVDLPGTTLIIKKIRSRLGQLPST